MTKRQKRRTIARNSREIAIIGMSGRFPRATNLDQYWENLVNGVDCIGEIPKDRWDIQAFFSENAEQRNTTYSRWGGFIEDAFDFDPHFFNISPKEAVFLDPQQRKVLEVAYEAIEDAGYTERQLQESTTGVFLGIMGRGYFDKIATENRDLAGHLLTSSLLGFIANRISFHFNLKGPSLSIDTLCSSSLVALHYACMSILAGECDQALSGGVYVNFSPQHYILLSRLGVLSKDGRCKTFDERADGIVSGEGVGIVLLKALERAWEDGDNIHAVIKGSFANNDGQSSRFTATSPEAQEEMLLRAYKSSGVDAATVQFIETHGTGTKLGDPIELMALKKAFAQMTGKKAFCALGSVKSNVGHLEPAAGIAGLTKVVLALKHRTIPPTIHIKRVNHYIDLVDSPFVINDKATSLEKVEGPLRAGISSFGMGGTNVHVVLEEAPKDQRTAQTSPLPCHLFTLSARNLSGLGHYAHRFKAYLVGNPVHLPDLCFTANTTRGAFDHRLGIICSSVEDLAHKLASFSERGEDCYDFGGHLSYRLVEKGKKKTIFLLHHSVPDDVNIDFADYNSVFGQNVAECQEFLDTTLARPLRACLVSRKGLLPNEKAAVLAAFQYAYAQTLLALGVEPDIVAYADGAQGIAAVLVGQITIREALQDLIKNGEIQLHASAQETQRAELVPASVLDAHTFSHRDQDVIFDLGIRIESKADAWLAWLHTLMNAYVKGVDLDWSVFYPPDTRKRVSLPTYPFERRRFILPEGEDRSPVKNNRIISRKHSLVYTQKWESFDHITCETVFGREAEAYFSEHNVLGEPVLPAAAYLEIVRVAAGEVFEKTVCSLADVVLLEPLIVHQDVAVHTRIERRKEVFNFTVASRPSGGAAEWKIHATGTVKPAPASSPRSVSVARLSEQCQELVSLDDFSAYLALSGIAYGPWFKVVSSIQQGSDQALAFIELGLLQVSREDQGYFLHPSLVDAALQAVLSLVMNDGVFEQRPYLPYTIKAVHIYGPVTMGCCCLVTLKEKSLVAIKADVSIFDEQGQVLVEIAGLTLKRALAAREERTDDGRKSGVQLEAAWDWFYQLEWKRKALEADHSSSQGSCLVFAHQTDLDRQFIASLETSGRDVFQVSRGKTFRALSRRHYQINPVDLADYGRLFQDIFSEAPALSSVVHLWSLTASRDTETLLSEGVYSVFFLLQALAQERRRQALELVLVSGSAQRVIAGDINHRPVAACMWGLAQVVPLEFPNIRCLCLDYALEDVVSGRDVAGLLADELNAALPDVAVAYRRGHRYVRALARAAPSPATPGPRIRPAGLYLITGGLGGIGLELTQHLTRHYQARVVLLSRSPLAHKNRSVHAAVEQMNQSGELATSYCVDINDENALAQVIQQVVRKHGRINGLFHAAGVIRDGLLKDKSFSDFAQVLAPKVQGILVLSHLLRDQGLDFVVLFSSISSLVGNYGQGDYGAANAFLDAFATLGGFGSTHTLSINWSYWQVGMGENLQQSARSKGYNPLEPSQALAALELALASGQRHLMIADRMDHAGKDQADVTKRAPARAEEKPALPATLTESVQAYLAQKLAGMLDLPIEDLDPETSFTMFGLDSILAVQLVRDIQKEREIELDPTTVFDYPSIKQLADFLCKTCPDRFTGARPVPPADAVYKDAQSNQHHTTRQPDLLQEELKSYLIAELAHILEFQVEDIDPDASFVDFGMDSLMASSFARTLSAKMDLELEPILVFDYPNVVSLADYLLTQHKQTVTQFVDLQAVASLPPTLEAPKQKLTETVAPAASVSFAVEREQSPSSAYPSREQASWEKRTNDIAIIGMSVRFPGADTLEQFWQNLASGICSSRPFPQARVDYDLAVYQDKDYVDRKDRLWGSYVDNIEYFDPLFFEISPQEAEFMDPQQRVMLETAWQAVEHAGYCKRSLSNSRTAVYIGACITEYVRFISELDTRAGTGNEISILANRISYFLDLKGPSLTIDTACSSSLVALDMACRSLRSGVCDMAIVGGVNLILTPWFSIVFEKAGMLSPDGLCKTFDEAANGYIRGEGAVAVVLKPLFQALEDRDHILAIIKGSAVNQDGRTNGITAPNTMSQEQVIRAAWEEAGIDPRTLSLVEAHGTGTSLGDPIEVKGLTSAFRHYTKDNGFCAIGSVKTNIGHLEAAAGLSGVVKVVAAMKHGKLPPTLHFNTKNKLIDFNQSPFYVNDRLWDWTSDRAPRRAAVSSFGFGGTNAHVALEEATFPSDTSTSRERSPFYVALLSAKSQQALEAKMHDLACGLGDGHDLDDVCYTLATGRDFYPFRCAIVAGDTRDLADACKKDLQSERVVTGRYKGVKKTKCVFLFGDQGRHHRTKGNALYEICQVFRASVDHCDEIVQALSGWSIVASWRARRSRQDPQELTLERAFSPFVIGYALAQQLKAWGVQPDAVIGYGVGLFAAACCAELLKPGDALNCLLAYHRGERNFTNLNLNGEPRFAPIPVLNAGNGTVVFNSVPGEAFWRLESSGSPIQMQEFVQEYIADHAVLVDLNNADPQVEQALRRETETQHSRFVQALVPRLDEYYSLMLALAHLFTAGISIDWESFYENSRARRIPLPAYPFQRKPYWYSGRTGASTERRSEAPSPARPAGKHKKIGYFQREWRPSPLGGEYALPHGYDVWLVFADSLDIADQIRSILEENGRRCIVVEPGASFTVVRRENYKIDPRVPGDYLALFDQVSQAFGRVDGILYLWPVHGDVNIVERQEQAQELLTLGVYGLFMVVQALLGLRPSKTLPLLTVTVNARYAAPGSWLSATNSALATLTKIIPYELENIVAKNIDLSLPLSKEAGQVVIQELCNWDGEEEISYQNNARMASRVQEVSVQRQPLAPLIAEGSVVLITGGASGVGLKVAQHLAATRNVKLALVGRSRLPLEEAATHLTERTDLDGPASKVRNIQLLQAKGYTVCYESADVADLDSMRLACKRIEERLGGIDALIHCAGVIDDSNISLRSKTLASFKAVLRPKVEGALALARISQEASIPVTIYFSSLAALSGATGVGFSDYAVANAFMDGLAALRDGSHSGRTVSISWPVWEAVGMSNRGLTTKEAFALTQEDALRAFDLIVDRPLGRHVVVLGCEDGDTDLLRFSHSQVKFNFPTRWTEQELAPDPPVAKPSTAAKTEWFLKATIGEFLKLDPDEIDSDINLGEYGVDSIAIADLMGRIEKRYGEYLDPSCILEHSTIATLSDFIDKRFGQPVEADQLAQEKHPVTPAGNGFSTRALLRRLYQGDISAAEALEQLLEQV